MTAAREIVTRLRDRSYDAHLIWQGAGAPRIRIDNEIVDLAVAEALVPELDRHEPEVVADTADPHPTTVIPPAELDVDALLSQVRARVYRGAELAILAGGRGAVRYRRYGQTRLAPLPLPGDEDKFVKNLRTKKQT